jgi:hypothetical protein
MQYLQAGQDYRHGRGTEDAGNIHQSTLGGRLLLRPCSRCLLCSNGGRRSALLRSCSHHLFNGGSVLPCGAGGWHSNCAKSSSTVGLDYDFQRAPHRVPLAFVALLDGLRWWHLLHPRKTTHQQVYSLDGYSTTLVKDSLPLGAWSP